MANKSENNEQRIKEADAEKRDEHIGMSESGVIARSENLSSEGEVVDQDPGMRQKQNQSGEKDDPLAA